MKRVLLGLGSNKSYKNYSSLEILNCAIHELSFILQNITFSTVHKTKAMYVENQDDFYNMVVLGFVNDDFNPFELLKQINIIEEKYGRNRKNEIRFGPRSLDIDIELFGDEKIDSPILQIPHPRIKERIFVLKPALEVLQKNADENIINEFLEYLSLLKE